MLRRFDFCKVHEDEGSDDDATSNTKPLRVSENLGQILLGERIFLSPYSVCQMPPQRIDDHVPQIHMKQDVQCAAVCKPKTYDSRSKANIRHYSKLRMAIKQEYMHSWCACGSRCRAHARRILDNMPAAE